MLIDWETALLAPPERDLWSLDSGDGWMLDHYAAATGKRPDASTLDLYRIRWDLADISAYVSRFRAPHSGTPTTTSHGTSCARWSSVCA